MEKIERKYQVKLMHKIFQNNKMPKTQSISLSQLKEHKLFKDFDFTLDQLVEMGSDNKELDELYTDQNYQVGLSGLILDQDVAKFNFEYIKEKQNYKVVKQLLYILAFFPSGMTLNDID